MKRYSSLYGRARMALGLLVVLALVVAGPVPAALAAPGDLDTSFDTDGRVTTNLGSTDTGRAVALQSDGKIVVAGSSNNLFIVARYNANGSLDTTGFGSPNGYVTTNIPNGADAANAVALQPDGKIVVAGSHANDFAVARYNMDGSLDTGFNSTGTRTLHVGSNADVAYAVAIQSDGKVVVAGATNNNFVVARFNSDGSLDTSGSFNPNGYVTTNFPGNVTDAAYAVALQGDGKIVAAGVSTNNFAVARYNTNGSLDTTFDTDGMVTTNFGSTDTANAVAVQPDGKIVAAGVSNNNFSVARYNTNGSLDTTFDTDGMATTDLGASEYGYGVAMQWDGKIVVAGRSGNNFAVVRYTTSGALDNTGTGSFGGANGYVTTDFGGTDYAYGVAIQPRDGRIVAVGIANNTDFAVARYKTEIEGTASLSDGQSATLAGVTVLRNSGAPTPCDFTVVKTLAPPIYPLESGTIPAHWNISTTCTAYNVDLTFAYSNDELTYNNNSVVEGSLHLYKSETGSPPWTYQGGTVDANANTVALSGVTALSDWALDDNGPTAVTMGDALVQSQVDGLHIEWSTLMELDVFGFDIYRSTGLFETPVKLNSELIPSQALGSTNGADYAYVDTTAQPGVTYFYWIEVQQVEGPERFGPQAATALSWRFLPLIAR